MKQLTYSLKARTPEKHSAYRPEELAGMTLLQLRDICEREKIVHAAVNRMDREELIHLILRFRGGRTAKLIREFREQGLARLEEALKGAKRVYRERAVSVPAKLTVYEDLDTNRFDGYRIPYDRELDGVNVLVVDKDGNVCALMAVEACPGDDGLYLTRSGRIPCRETPARGYRLLVFPPALSDTAYDLYMGVTATLPNPVSLYSIPLIGFSVRKPEEVSMPLSIDFGTSNTVAGIYIEPVFYRRIADGIREGQLTPGAVNYVLFTDGEGKPTPVLPSVVGIRKIEQGEVRYCFGGEAERLLERGYLDDGVCVFYDMKRWVGDYEAEEEVTDPWGASLLVPRREILQAYLRYVIASAEQRFKCRVKSINLPFPVKQKERFYALYRELLPEYAISERELMDEGVSVIYSTIASLVDEKQFESGAWYRALIIDCGGGTTDLSSCAFSIADDPVAYRIQIETSYENGDTDFGGNNLTFVNKMTKSFQEIVDKDSSVVYQGGSNNISERIKKAKEELFVENTKLAKKSLETLEKEMDGKPLLLLNSMLICRNLGAVHFKDSGQERAEEKYSGLLGDYLKAAGEVISQSHGVNVNPNLHNVSLLDESLASVLSDITTFSKIIGDSIEFKVSGGLMAVGAQASLGAVDLGADFVGWGGDLFYYKGKEGWIDTSKENDRFFDFSAGAHIGLKGSKIEAGADINEYYSVPKRKKLDQAIWEVPGADIKSSGTANIGPFSTDPDSIGRTKLEFHWGAYLFVGGEVDVVIDLTTFSEEFDQAYGHYYLFDKTMLELIQEKIKKE